MGESLIVISTEGIIQTVNQAAITLFGYNEQEILGRSISDIFAKEQRLIEGKGIEEAITKEINNLELTCISKDGGKIPVLLSATNIHNKENNFHGLVCIILDITQRKLAEEQFQKLSSAVEQSPVSVVITDTQGNIEYINPKFTSITGYSYDEVVGKNQRILKSDHTTSEDYKNLWNVITSGGEWRGVFHNKKKNGELFWESAFISSIKNTEGEITHYLAVKEDITEQLEKEKQLTHALKMEAVGQLTSGIAHDFRNILTVILGNLQLLQEGIIQKDSQLITDALTAAHDGSELVMRLLAFSRRKEKVNQTLDVNVSLQCLQGFLQNIVHENLDISLALSETPPIIKADHNRLESAILNLVTNAQDAMPEGGELTITTNIVKVKDQKLTDPVNIHPGNYVTISISDNGVGMSEDTRQRALEAYYSTKNKGTGLGLSMVNDFINDSGGAIYIESSHGVGTTITLWFPVDRTTGNHKNKTEVIDSLPTGTETILLVEDNHKVRVFANRTLTHLGYHIVEKVDATEALEYIQQHKDIDLLFTDIVMPGDVNGIGLAKTACILLPSLRVLLTTGMYSHMDDHGIPVMDYPLLAKPYTAKQLARSIRNMLDTGQLSD